jgi:CelD/BcsL family acetyltransferase involved in cellulose biosynthesis
MTDQLSLVRTQATSIAESFDGLAAEWDDLVARCSRATPFQLYAWLESWWRAYGTAGRLRVVLVRRDERLVAAGAFMLHRRGGCPVLTPIGGACSDFTDVLVDDTDPATAAEAGRALAAAIVALPGWQALDFPETRPDALAGGLLAEAWPGRHFTSTASLCLELPAMQMEDLVRELPQHTRKTVKRRLNQLRKADPDIRAIEPDDADQAIWRLLRLHAAQWAGRGVNEDHLTPAYAAHLGRAVPAMIRAGQAALLEYRFDGKLLASSLVLIGRDLVGGYLYGAEPELRERVDITTMLLADTLPMAHRLGLSTMSMLRGAEEHKHRWRPQEVQNRRVVLSRPDSVRGVAYASGVLAYRRAVELAKRRAPWLRTVRDWVKRPSIAGHGSPAKAAGPQAAVARPDRNGARQGDQVGS